LHTVNFTERVGLLFWATLCKTAAVAVAAAINRTHGTEDEAGTVRRMGGWAMMSHVRGWADWLTTTNYRQMTARN